MSTKSNYTQATKNITMQPRYIREIRFFSRNSKRRNSSIESLRLLECYYIFKKFLYFCLNFFFFLVQVNMHEFNMVQHSRFYFCFSLEMPKNKVYQTKKKENMNEFLKKNKDNHEKYEVKQEEG